MPGENNKFLSFFIFILSLIYFSCAIYYYITGYMGTMFWVLVFVPLAYILYVLQSLKNEKLYPRFGKFQYIIAGTYITLCLFAIVYLPINYMELIYYRAGSYNLVDKFVGVSLFLLILEYARREHKVLFGLAIFLIVYCLYGEYFPGILRQPGISLDRVLTSSTVEIKLGIFGTYAQVGAGIIGAFLLLMGAAKGFGVDRSLIKTIIGTLGKKPTLIPQTAVVSSMAVATCTGSGAADSALVGQFTIPAMRRAGFPPIYAAATEGSAALGGLIMPPVMAIAAFIMAEFLGVSYFEVILRGFVLAFIYYFSIALTVYLLTLQYVRVTKLESAVDIISKIGKPTLLDKTCTMLFFACIILLIYLMGGLWWPEIRAALAVVIVFLVGTSILHLTISGRSDIKSKLSGLSKNLRGTVEGYPEVIVDIMLLLATLGILINLFTVSGWLMKLGMILLSVGQESFLLLIALGFVFAFFLGFGLPPSAVYIITAVLIAPQFTYFGINPWVAHFFIFLVAAISEFTPPVALIAAVTSRIAETPFVKTAFYTQKWILPIYLMIFTVFKWDELVVEPGVQQLIGFLIVLTACLAITVGSFGKLSGKTYIDFAGKIPIVLLGFFVLFYPEKTLSAGVALLLLLAVVVGIKRTQTISTYHDEK
ncbi:hypothetical protein DRP07_06045 [Archaeoglobales archaeon]|nr:MAG: hypothetical protein DRP07_06045 [Archaeoglobales archaeon]